MSERRICVVTGSRADYGLLHPLMDALRSADDFDLQVIATGMHLAPEFGSTYKIIEDDGFKLDARVDMLLSSDTPTGVAKSVGLGVIGFADALAVLQPDLVLVLGDRFEILAAVQAALFARIPVAHIAGGDLTEGAVDDAIRHSITKMAHLHFVTNTDAAQRVRQLGEDPRHIFNVGSPGIDNLLRTARLNRAQLEAALGLHFQTAQSAGDVSSLDLGGNPGRCAAARTVRGTRYARRRHRSDLHQTQCRYGWPRTGTTD